MDHAQFDEAVLAKATAAILKTRDGLLRAAVPSPIGSCVFLNDVSGDEMNEALRRHKEIMKQYPRNGEGLDAYVDASDTGYTENGKAEEESLVEKAAVKAGDMNGNALIGKSSGNAVNGHGFVNGKTNGHGGVNGKVINGNGTSGKESNGDDHLAKQVKNMMVLGS